MVQVDGSVNAGNSGASLIDIETGSVLGIVTRKGTGLTRLFHELRETLKANIGFISEQAGGGGIAFGAFNVIDATIANQYHILSLLTSVLVSVVPMAVLFSSTEFIRAVSCSAVISEFDK